MDENIHEPEELMFTAQTEGNKVFMLLNRSIGPDASDLTIPYIDGAKFAEEMYRHKARGKEITVKINSPGGRVTHGWSLIDAIIENGARTINAGMAYSMAAYCLLFGKFRQAYDYASLMLHAPRGGNPEYLPVVHQQFRTLLEKRTKLTKDEIEEIMTSGRDHKFTAQEMLEKGLIDEIISTGRKIQVPDATTTAQLHEIFNSSLQSELNTISMENILAKLLGKKTEEEGIAAAMEYKAKAESLQAALDGVTKEKNDLAAKVTALEAAAQLADSKSKAVELIAAAEKDGKLATLTPESRTKLVESATAHFESVKFMFDNMAVAGPKKARAAVDIIDSTAKGETKTYEWLAKHEPEKLAHIAENDPELFNKLSDEYLAKEKAGK